VKRLQLFEFEDQEWLPNVIRDGITGVLNIMQERWKLYTPIVPRLRVVLRELKAKRIIDLCSGSGGPWTYLATLLNDSQTRPLKVFLTDKFPGSNYFELTRFQTPDLEFVAQPVDATKVPKELNGFRTLFNSFHHFCPEDATRILQDAVTDGEGIALFELTRRNLLDIVYIALFSFASAIIYTPFIKPFRWPRLVLTYLLPIIPFLLAFDGIVSCLRTYSTQELRDMVAKLTGNNDYNWEIGTKNLKYFPGGVTYLVGYPKKNSTFTS
jgi:hypothetical protein